MEPKIALYAFEKVLKENSLLSVDLGVNEVSTIEAFMTRANKFIEIEEKKISKGKGKLPRSPCRDTK